MKSWIADTWRATLHIEVFLPAQVTGFRAGLVDGKPDLSGDDRDPGNWQDGLPRWLRRAMSIVVMTIMALWSSADLTYSITYEM